VDDVVIKTRESSDLIADLEETFSSLRIFGGNSILPSAFLEYLQGNCSGSSLATGASKPTL
jgi:hypothetical protein